MAIFKINDEIYFINFDMNFIEYVFIDWIFYIKMKYLY